jgi:hypothetical protein
MADKGTAKQGGDLGGEQAQAKMDKEQDQGYRGVKVDTTPDENYSVAGVTSGAPTPETDPKMAEKVGGTKFTGTQPVKEKK